MKNFFRVDFIYLFSVGYLYRKFRLEVDKEEFLKFFYENGNRVDPTNEGVEYVMSFPEFHSIVTEKTCNNFFRWYDMLSPNRKTPMPPFEDDCLCFYCAPFNEHQKTL